MDYQVSAGFGAPLLVDERVNIYPMEYAPISAIKAQPLVALRDWFTSRARDGRTMDLAAFELDSLKALLPIVSLFRLVVLDGDVVDYQVRVTSKTLESMFGVLPTGSGRDELPPALFSRWGAVAQKVVDRAAPIYARSRTMADDGLVRRGESLALPLCMDGVVSQILVGTVFGPVEHTLDPR